MLILTGKIPEITRQSEHCHSVRGIFEELWKTPHFSIKNNLLWDRKNETYDGKHPGYDGNPSSWIIKDRKCMLCVCLCMCVCAHAWNGVCMHVCVCVCVCAHACAYVCICACIRVCVRLHVQCVSKLQDKLFAVDRSVSNHFRLQPRADIKSSIHICKCWQCVLIIISSGRCQAHIF